MSYTGATHVEGSVPTGTGEGTGRAGTSWARRLRFVPAFSRPDKVYSGRLGFLDFHFDLLSARAAHTKWVLQADSPPGTRERKRGTIVKLPARPCFGLVALIASCLLVGTSCSEEGSSAGNGTSLASVIKVGSVTVECLGWKEAAETKVVRLKEGEKGIGITYFAVNTGSEPTGFLAGSLRLRSESASKDARPSTMLSAVLSEGALGGPLLPGEPIFATVYYKVPKSDEKFVWVHKARKSEEQTISLPTVAGTREPSAEMKKAASVKPSDVSKPVSVDKWTIQVEEVTTGDEINGEKPPSGIRLLEVRVLLKNNGSENRKINFASAARVKTPRGSVHSYVGDPTTTPMELAKAIREGRSPLLVKADPGQSVTATLGFYVPDSEKVIWLDLDPSAKDPGKALFALPTGG